MKSGKELRNLIKSLEYVFPLDENHEYAIFSEKPDRTRLYQLVIIDKRHGGIVYTIAYGKYADIKKVIKAIIDFKIALDLYGKGE